MKKYLTLTLILIICSCESFIRRNPNQHVSPQYVVLASKIRYEVAEKLAKEFLMKPVGEGGSFYDCVRELFLAFEIQGPLTKDRLRNILIHSVEECLSAVNNNEEIRPYLIVYPFTPQEIEIVLYVKSKRREDIYDPNIGVASARKGELEYMITDKTDTFKYKSIVSESYDEALRIVRGQ
jgi:hypothetical protein